ncbi:MAG: SUMF1/EgtB/PvdO family nonheme iron enzyme, partial [Gammaproteobacteria bacterium]|nr:SUMF1/EgtB/PvdO family nonheme iron enzyme [Gammaproteobacteria bacterium]
LITGDGNSVRTIINYYRDQADQPPDEATLRRQIASYLTWMLDRYGTIELRGIKRKGVQVVQLNLEAIYVPLQAETYQQSGQIALNQVLNLGQHIVITGNPGCGKTTVLLHLAWTIAQAIDTDDLTLAKNKLGLTSSHSLEGGVRGGIGLPLPILVPLSSYALYLRQLPHGTSSELRTLAAFISEYLIQKQTSFELPTDFFKQLLRSDGQNVILLLDGLDEVPNEDERAVVRQAIEDLITGRDRMRVVVTCRTAAYEGRTALGKGFQEIQVLPLNENQIENLVRHAYADIYHNEADAGQDKADELLNTISRLEQRRQRFDHKPEPLIASPLLVRMLLIVHYSERHIPELRAELYMKATDAMLLPEYSLDEDLANRLGKLVGSNREVHRDLVQHLAFEMHQRGNGQDREIDENELLKILQTHPLYPNFAKDLIKITRLRGTLLEEREGRYRFIHLAFQEYLAARYLAETVRSEQGVAGIVSFLEAGPIVDSWWREPALLVAGYLSVTVPTAARNYLLRLAWADDQAGQRPQTLSPDIQLAAVEVAWTAALEWSTVPPALKEKLTQQLADWFDKKKSNLLSQTEPTRRVMVRNALTGRSGKRPGITDLESMRFCYVPPGPFWMGDVAGDKLVEDNPSYIKENSLHKTNISYGYWLARYPVTVAQFAAFVEDKRYQPTAISNRLRGLADHPVINVTWYDALYFCQWLTTRWQKKGILSNGWHVTLPSEAEWEKAARGGLEYPQQNIIRHISQINNQGWSKPSLQANQIPRRRYPWGDKIDRMQVNYKDTRLSTTNAVGCFPGGASPYGCEEMSGNVWEWTRSMVETYPYDPDDGREDIERDSPYRVSRGGSFKLGAHKVRCAIRLRYNPRGGVFDFGFRVMLSPSSASKGGLRDEFQTQ